MKVRNCGIKITKELFIKDYRSPIEVSTQLTCLLEEQLKKQDSDFLLLLGDRFEMLACATAALLTNIPIIHVGGGYVTHGSNDDMIRHAISKMSHFHFVANYKCAQRVIQMGESPNRVHIVGAPDLDMVRMSIRASRKELMDQFNMDSSKDFILCTIHPCRSDKTENKDCYKEIFKVLAKRAEQILITAPAPDEGADEIFQRINLLQKGNRNVFFSKSLGEQLYISAMVEAKSMFGNSSSGIIESTAVPVPAVNIGARQSGREHGENVITVPLTAAAMNSALDQACSAEFGEAIREVTSPYGDGEATEKITKLVTKIAELPKEFKKFHEYPIS